MRTVAEHAAIVTALLHPTGSETVPLAQTAGRVLSADLIAPIDLPPFANSAMDGYAARATDVSTLPVTLPVSQDIPAGRTDVVALAPGTVARIMTGAPIPAGTEVIVPVEGTDAGTEQVRITAAPPPGAHLRGRGEDVAAGTIVLDAGTVIGAPQIGVAAALGMAELTVRRRVRVLVLSTGSELVAPGTPLRPGQIYESNSLMLAAALTDAGADARIAHFVADDVAEFHDRIRSAATDVDLIVTSGGVSAGAYEVVKDALTGQGVEFAKVAMQPGMPQGAGHLAGTPIVTLPGNPVSSYISFEVFLRPPVRAAMGFDDCTRPALRVPLSAPLDSPAGKRQFRRGVLDTIGGAVAPWGGPGSHLLGFLAGADALIVVPEEVGHLEAGDEVEVWLIG